MKWDTFRVKVIDLHTREKVVILNSRESRSKAIKLYDRLKILHEGQSLVARVCLTDELVGQGYIGIPSSLADFLGVEDEDEVNVGLASIPMSVEYIRKKMEGHRLSREEISAIIKDIVEGEIGPLETLAFALAEHFVGMSDDEIEDLIRSMVDTGERLSFDDPAYDKHSIGGVPGNKVSLLIVPIVASAGLLIPKTSSRAITSPSGTADTMEVLANVEFTNEEITAMVKKVRGCIVWGGKLNLAPADDIIIRAEYPLRIDPEPQMIASIMAKKMAAGISNLVIDIPTGKGTKVETISDAERLAQKFVTLGTRLGINVKCGITYGEQPVGHAVGPALEAREAIRALMGKGPASLIEKSLSLAGLLLEIGGVAPKGSGYSVAEGLWRKGKAYEKMRQIIEAQGGDPNVKPDDIPVGQYVHALHAEVDGYVTRVDNATIARIARAAGAPKDKGAGVLLHAKRGYKVKKGDVLVEVYADRSTKLQDAVKILNQITPIVVEGMLLKTVSRDEIHLGV